MSVSSGVCCRPLQTLCRLSSTSVGPFYNPHSRLLAGSITTRCVAAAAPSGTASRVPGRSGAAPCRPYSTDSARPSGSNGAAILKPPPFAFAFDIDGVLLHVAQPIPGAREALRFLHDRRIPFILLTNGGGKFERDRVAELSSKLEVPLTTDNFVQSHTPFRQLAEEGPGSLRDKTILVTGSDGRRAREIAEEYGFKNVIIPADILKQNPDIWPYDPLLTHVYYKPSRQPNKWVSRPGLPEEAALKIDAIFVFDDPRDWALDIQLITDLLLSRQGYLGTYSALNAEGKWQEDGQPTLYFSNADLLWSAQWHIPRLGQGSFQAAVAGIWDRITDGKSPLRRTVIGKPTPDTYRFAERVLADHRLATLEKYHQRSTHPPLSAVYMVGDNPESDIAGANSYQSEIGAKWSSLLVRTGVWHPERGGEMKHKPTAIVDDVREAVRWALRREGWEGEF